MFYVINYVNSGVKQERNMFFKYLQSYHLALVGSLRKAFNF